MHDLNTIVIPRINAEWEDVVYALQYEIQPLIPSAANIKVIQLSAVKNSLKTGSQQVMVLDPKLGRHTQKSFKTYCSYRRDHRIG